MGNTVTEKYFSYKRDLKNEIKKILKEISAKSGFIVKKEIFRGHIQDKNKVGSIIYGGIYKNKPSVLKLQALELECNEAEIAAKFNKQNKSKNIRLPKIYKHKKWTKDKQYGYLITEKITGKPIYKYPFASRGEIKEFCRIYQEYKQKALIIPFFKKTISENSSLLFVLRRVTMWSKIAEAKKILTKTNICLIEKFTKIAARHLPNIKMKLMHGHYSINDIYKVSNRQYVFMSNLFWGYRPEYYDAAFNLWADILNIKSKKANNNIIISYYNKWIDEYKKLDIIKKDKDFERKMDMMMLERCIGALVLDIPNKLDQGNCDKTGYGISKKLFTGLCNYLSEKLIIRIIDEYEDVFDAILIKKDERNHNSEDYVSLEVIKKDLAARRKKNK